MDMKKYFSIVQPVVIGLRNPSSGNLKNNRGMTQLHKSALAARRWHKEMALQAALKV